MSSSFTLCASEMGKCCKRWLIRSTGLFTFKPGFSELLGLKNKQTRAGVEVEASIPGHTWCRGASKGAWIDSGSASCLLHTERRGHCGAARGCLFVCLFVGVAAWPGFYQRHHIAAELSHCHHVTSHVSPFRSDAVSDVTFECFVMFVVVFFLPPSIFVVHPNGPTV